MRENCCIKQRKTTRIVPGNFLKKMHSSYGQLNNSDFFFKIYFGVKNYNCSEK